MTELGRLEPIKLRDIWETEAGDFTPWLARAENLALLGETIGVDLELEAQEKYVGPFRADILCKDMADGHWVLIENQIERTDHTHLGQLLTYAAGLKAVTIVWIADRFTDEHRAALDWLNEITDDRFRFFGLEVELWRIGKSPAAPRFNMVGKPNDWTKRGGPFGPGPSGELSEMQLLRREYWAEFNKILEVRASRVRPRKPQPQHWMTYAVGRGDFKLAVAASTNKKWLAVSLWCEGRDAKAHFHLLRAEREAIEREIGVTLGWEEPPGKKTSYINVYKHEVDPTDKAHWPEQHQWMAETLDAFHRVFAPRVKKLDVDDYVPEGEDDTQG